MTYCLYLEVTETLTLKVGALGSVQLPSGHYVYTGSARRGLEARIARHLKQRKNKRWHIDYLTSDLRIHITGVTRHRAPECRVNQAHGGEVVTPGLGASDCLQGCGSHLRYLGRNTGR